MAEDAAKAKLLAILQSRGIPLGLDDVQWAFESGTTKKETVAWIEEYLSDSTLLTRDELDLYEAIGESTKLELSSSSHDTVPLQDRDIKEAIAALRSSTSAIENHAKALETQRDMLLKLQSTGDGSSHETSKIAGKYAQERSSLSFSVEEIAFTVNEQLKEAEDQSGKALTELKASCTERLAADEKVLEALSGLSSKALSTAGPNVKHSELEKWFQALAALRAGEVRARIDTMLAPAGPALNENLDSEGAELQAELVTLKDEIDSVVHMVIGHELRNPLMKGLEASEKSIRQSRQSWSKYLLSTLEYLISQLDRTSTRICDLRNYTDALLEIRSTLAAIENESTAKAENATNNVATLEVRQNLPSSVPQSPNSMIPMALRRLNVKSPSSSPDDLAQLTKLSLDSHAKLQSQYSSTEKTFIDTLGKSLAPRQQNALAILQQLYASSSFSTIHLTDEGSEGKIKELGKRIDELAPKVAAGDLR